MTIAVVSFYTVDYEDLSADVLISSRGNGDIYYDWRYCNLSDLRTKLEHTISDSQQDIQLIFNCDSRTEYNVKKILDDICTTRQARSQRTSCL